MSKNSTPDTVNNNNNTTTTDLDTAMNNMSTNDNKELSSMEVSSSTATTTATSNGGTIAKAAIKKASIASHYRLRKRRSAFLQSDTSSENDDEESAKDINSTTTNDDDDTNNHHLSINSSTTNPSGMVDDNSCWNLQGTIPTNTNQPSCKDEESLNRSFTPDFQTTTTTTAAAATTTVVTNETDNSSKLTTMTTAKDEDSIYREVLSDFIEKASTKEPSKGAPEYASILRLFALQYTTFPARIIDHRFTPLSYEHSDNVKPDYKLISPFIYYHVEFTSFELSFYYQMLILMLHSKICRVPQICMNRLCMGYQAIVLHLKQCYLFKCKNVYCFSARLVLHHVVTCSKDLCKFCPTIPPGVVDYCKHCLYENDQNNKLIAILKSCFSAPCISIKNEEYSAAHTRKILNHILNDYICIDKNSYAETSNKVLASIDRNKVVNDIIQSINKNKIDVTSHTDNLLLDCTNFENTLYHHSHNKDIYLQSVSNICQMLQFFSQVMIKTQINPMEELEQIVAQTAICGVSVRTMMYHNTPTTSVNSRDPIVSGNGNCGNVRNLSYGYENSFKFTPTAIFPSKKVCDHFLPLIQDMFNSPDGAAFQLPVDPVYFMIYDYYDIIQYPMDLHTIITRLKERFYVDPWEVIHDVWQTVKNAWLYNRRTTRVYKIATRLKDMFLEKVEPVMKTLNLCCAYRRVLTPQPLFCMGKDYCVIHREAVYYVYQNYYIYCERCFNEISGNAVSIALDEDDDTNDSIKIEEYQQFHTTTTTTTTAHDVNSNQQKSAVVASPPTKAKTKLVDKSDFIRETNSKVFMEHFVECKQCNRRMHQVCQLHTTEIDGIYFYCDDCLGKMPKLPKINRYTSERLMETHMSTFIEQRVNDMLINKLSKQVQPIRIRMVYNNLKKLKTSTIITEYFKGQYPSEFVYHSKALFAFQKLNDGTEICFFGMHVQEFDNNAPEPNRGRAYLSYLDSVHFFQPKHLKTQVYFTILTAYFEYVKRRGFSYVHLWACPPCEGDDYIFHCHPTEQRVPKHKRLVDWYRKLLDECVKLKIFTKVKDLHKYLVSEKSSQLTLIPYFEGDYWPNTFEDVINEVRAEQNPNEVAVVGNKAKPSSSSLSRGRAMLMQNYDKEDTEEDATNSNTTTNNDDDDIDEVVVAAETSSTTTTTEHMMSDTVKSESSIATTNKHSSKFTKKKRPSKSTSKSQRHKKSKLLSTSSSAPKKRNEPTVPEFLTVEQRLFNLLERFKDVFFVCRLNNNSTTTTGGGSSSSCSIAQNDMDPPIHCDLTDGRSGFLQLCRERKWEFSTCLRTKFTTLGFLVELHIQFGDRFIFTCNNCKCHLFNKYHCTICTDFDLCYKCFYIYGHEHQMVEVSDDSNNNSNVNLANFNRANLLSNQTLQQHMPYEYHHHHQQQQHAARMGIGGGSNCTASHSNNFNQCANVPNNVGANLATATNVPSPSVLHTQSQQTNIIVAQELLDIILHCSTCPIESVYQPCAINVKCQRMRIAIKHCNECNAPNRLKCPICHSLMTLCVPHARGCRTPNCRVVFCKKIRDRICFNPSSSDSTTTTSSSSTNTTNKNHNRPSYQPRSHISPSFDIQRRMAQMHHPNYMHSDSQPNNVNVNANPNLVNEEMSFNSNTGRIGMGGVLQPPPSSPQSSSSSVIVGHYPTTTTTTTTARQHISPTTLNSGINIANRNAYIAQKDPNYYNQQTLISFRNSNNNSAQLQQSSSANEIHNNDMMMMGGGGGSGSNEHTSSANYNRNPNVLMSTPLTTHPNNPNLSYNPMMNISRSDSSNNNSFVGKDSQIPIMPNFPVVNDHTSSPEALFDSASFFNPLKNNLFNRAAVYETELSTSDTSCDNPPKTSPNNTIPGGINLSPSNIVYLKDIPALIDPYSNPSIPVRDILAYNLRKLKQILDSNIEECEKNVAYIINYVKLFPYVMCHLSDNQQNLVVDFLKNKQSTTIKLDEKREALVLFLHRLQAARIIQKIQRQHQIYTGHVDSISQSVQQQSNHALKSLWTMPKKQIIDFVNSFRIMNESNNTICELKPSLLSNNSVSLPTSATSTITSSIAIDEDFTKTEGIETPTINLIQNTQKIAEKFSIVGNASMNRKNLSNISYVAPNSYNNVANVKLEYYLKALLSNNPNNLSAANSANSSQGNGCVVGDTKMDISPNSVQRENIPFISGRGSVERVKSPSVKEGNLPNLAMFSCDANQKTDLNTVVSSSSASDQLPPT